MHKAVSIPKLDEADRSSAEDALRKIASFGQLAEGWAYGEGIAPSPQVMRAACDMARRLSAHGCTATDAFPGYSGEIMVTGYHGDDVIEVTVEPDLRATVVHERDGVELSCLDDLALPAAHDATIAIAKKIWPGFACSIQDTTTA